MTGARGDLAHIAHVELLTPKPQESLEFFRDVMGMAVVERAGQSVFLRGSNEYQHSSLKLTEARAPGLGHMAVRATSAAALDRCVARVERAGLGDGWVDGDAGHGPAYRFQDPDGHVMELLWEVERFVPEPGERPLLKNQPARVSRQGAAVKRIDHVNLLARDVHGCRTFAGDALGYRLYERIVADDDSETGAWLSLSIAAHELIYVQDATPAHGRLHHVAWWVDTREEVMRAADVFLDYGVPIEFAPSKHTISQGFFLYVFEPGGNRVEVTSGGYFVYDPEHEPTTWTPAERARGQAWGVPTVESFHYYGTPPYEGAPDASGRA